MIQIKPAIPPIMRSRCPHCGEICQATSILWQGIHVCKAVRCSNCSTLFVEDLPIGHAIIAGFKVDLTHMIGMQTYGEKGYQSWFGRPFLMSLLSPNEKENIEINKEVFWNSTDVIIVNCLDYLYGHSLLKLLNVEYYVNRYPQYGVIVIVPRVLRWMVPEGVAEIWEIDLPFVDFLQFFPSLNSAIGKECERFSSIYLSKAYPHPKYFNISLFTRIKKHSFSKEEWRITFVWRSDRIWCKEGVYVKALEDFQSKNNAIQTQISNVCELFLRLKRVFPAAIYTVAGLGCEGRLPEWIDDCRVDKYSFDDEKRVCQIYSDSRLVVGIHGSNMILPSAHAGLTLDIIPDDRWGNLGQDIGYQEEDIRMIVHRYIHVPVQVEVKQIAWIAENQIKNYSHHHKLMNYIPQRPNS
ncbi:MAG: hypothetical protein GYA36_05595 [Veillonellaceae bacterium]|nr:hypothetical protein [Veillonellaceae bacterium]